MAALENRFCLRAANAWPAFHKSLHADSFYGIAIIADDIVRINLLLLYALEDPAALLPHSNRDRKILSPLFRREAGQAAPASLGCRAVHV